MLQIFNQMYKFENISIIIYHIFFNQSYIILLSSFFILFFLLQDGYTALILASRDGKIECVKSLIDAKADVNIQNKVCDFDNILY